MNFLLTYALPHEHSQHDIYPLHFKIQDVFALKIYDSIVYQIM